MLWWAEAELSRAGEAETSEVLRLALRPAEPLSFAANDFNIRLSAFPLDAAVIAELHGRLQVNLAELFQAPTAQPPTRESVLEAFDRVLDESFAAPEDSDPSAAQRHGEATTQALMFATHRIERFAGISLSANDQL